MPLPPIYQDAGVRTITPRCPLRERVGLAFDMPDGAVLRLAVPEQDARLLHAYLARYLALCGCQSLKSSEMSSSDGSPQDGQNVPPVASSSAAVAALEYGPSASSSNMACHIPSGCSRTQKVPARVG